MKRKTPPQIQIGKYIDPLTDFGFKFLFGNEPNKELLIAFLNELLRGCLKFICRFPYDDFWLQLRWIFRLRAAG